MKLDHIVNQPVIETDNFDVRPLRKGDIGVIDLYAGDLRVAEGTTSIPHPLPPGTTEAYFNRVTSDDRMETVWALDATKIGGAKLMGVISLKHLERDQSQIGGWIAPAFWNKGLAQNAVQALVASNPLKNKIIFATVFQDNPASARVLTNNGFEYLGDAESFSVSRNAKVATWTYSLKLG